MNASADESRNEDPPRLRAITKREGSIFACAAQALLEPTPDLPPVDASSAVVGLDRWLAASPALNRRAVRASLYVLELAPLFSGRRRRFRRLPPDARLRFLAPDGGRRPAWTVTLVDTLRMLAAAVYYGDDGVAAKLGYDADERLRRGRDLRAAEGRP